MFEATRFKFRDIDFKKIDAAQPNNRYLMDKYNVRGFPRFVFLDFKGDVIFNGFVPLDAKGFETAIKRYH